ncbi:hypothetical protein FDG2_5731 [Candidatus Protofrankia californiensis]|uniref:Uncharacterized protein n=2 Tax=Protofrankia TaxID=2994361 RepID=A0A1C3PFB5_9ACTN|nr:hypothetical protein FDG2_5731 [Candidatus Protofrankia californiensis]
MAVGGAQNVGVTRTEPAQNTGLTVVSPGLMHARRFQDGLPGMTGTLAGGSLTGGSLTGVGRAGVTLGDSGVIGAFHGQIPATAVAAGHTRYGITTAGEPACPRIAQDRLGGITGQGRSVVTGGDVERIRRGKSTVAPLLA